MYYSYHVNKWIKDKYIGIADTSETNQINDSNITIWQNEMGGSDVISIWSEQIIVDFQEHAISSMFRASEEE